MAIPRSNAKFSISELASEALEYFATREGKNGAEEIYTESPPQWVRDMIYEAHCDLEPNNYTYKVILSALNNIVSGMNDDNIYQYIHVEVDTDIEKLIIWLDSDTLRLRYLTQTMDEFKITGSIQVLSMSQFLEIQDIFAAVLSFLDNKTRETNN